MVYAKIFQCCQVNPLTAKLCNLNFHPLEVVSRWRDQQLHVSENYLDLQNGGQLFSNISDWCHILSLSSLNGGTWCANKKWEPEDMRHRRLKGWHNKWALPNATISTPSVGTLVISIYLLELPSVKKRTISATVGLWVESLLAAADQSPFFSCAWVRYMPPVVFV